MRPGVPDQNEDSGYVADPNNLVGAQIGQYQVMQHIARGGMADVYLALDTDLQRQVVLKILLSNFAQDSGFVERFRREAQAMAQLHHPNVVQVYAIGTTGDRQPYIAMQYVAEGTLSEKLAELGSQQQILTTPYALALARQVADALGAAHRKGIVHRDLKPSNILLEANGKPLLTDLGIAVIESNPRLTQTNVLLGTPHYMSPEQVKGEPVDGRSDIYSLGIILYELFAGTRPFTADVQWGVLHKQIYEEARPLNLIRRDLPPEVTAIVSKCMQKLPEDRYQTAEEMVAALDQALQLVGAPGQMAISGSWLWQPPDADKLVTSGSKIVAPPPATVIREPVSDTVARSRRRWPYALLLLLLIPLCGFGGWQVWLRTQQPELSTPESTPEMTGVDNTAVTPISVVDSAATVSPTDTAVPPTLTATATASPSPTATVLTGEIDLMRPGDDNYTLADEIEFAWRWPASLSSDQFFTLYFIVDGKEQRAMSVEKPAAGFVYQMQFIIGDVLVEPGTYRWFIVLESEDADEPLLQSVSRKLTIVEEGAASETTTATAAATTARPTATSTRVVATATPRPGNTAVPQPTNTAPPQPQPTAQPQPTNTVQPQATNTPQPPPTNTPPPTVQPQPTDTPEPPTAVPPTPIPPTIPPP